MKLDKHTTTVFFIGLTVISVLASVDLVTINNKTAIILPLPPTILSSNPPPNKDLPHHSTDVNFYSTPPAITASGTSASISQVAATLKFTSGTQTVEAMKA